MAENDQNMPEPALKYMRTPEVSHDRFWKYYYAINRFGICPIALANINDILSDVSHLYFVCQMQSSIIDVM